MSGFKKTSDEISFVAVGNFNPGIFHPQWFLRHDLVEEADMTEPVLEMIVTHPEVSQFKTWFYFDVSQTRMVFSTSDMSRSEDLRDLIFNIFHILPETPITAIGFNKQSIISCDSDELWHHIGHTLAPKDVWLKAIPEAGNDISLVGMKIIELEFKRWDDLPGAIRISVYPSKHPPSPEVTFRYNDHVSCDKMSEFNDSLVLDHWANFMTSSDDILTRVLGEIHEQFE